MDRPLTSSPSCAAGPSSDPSWADAIRVAARARTLAHHTFDHRVAALEDAWDTPVALLTVGQ